MNRPTYTNWVYSTLYQKIFLTAAQFSYYENCNKTKQNKKTNPIEIVTARRKKMCTQHPYSKAKQQQKQQEKIHLGSLEKSTGQLLPISLTL